MRYKAKKKILRGEGEIIDSITMTFAAAQRAQVNHVLYENALVANPARGIWDMMFAVREHIRLILNHEV